ncbi:MAG: hypothetical protein ABFD46_12735, partial [Armatimonadota bacterium]
SDTTYRVSGDKVTALQLYKQFSDVALSVDFTLIPETLPEDFRQQPIYDWPLINQPKIYKTL